MARFLVSWTIAAAAALTLSSPAAAQQAEAVAPNSFAGLPAAAPADVASPHAIVAALYDVISGDVGVKRDRNRFLSLFYPGARLIPTGANPHTGRIGAEVLTPEQFVELSAPLMESKGFFEREVAHRVESFAGLAHVFSTYESRFRKADPKPFARGINSIQLVNDGKRWWVLTIAWSEESDTLALPQRYLKNGD
jgi:hypothetical protein